MSTNVNKIKFKVNRKVLLSYRHLIKVNSKESESKKVVGTEWWHAVEMEKVWK